MISNNSRLGYIGDGGGGAGTLLRLTDPHCEGGRVFKVLEKTYSASKFYILALS